MSWEQMQDQNILHGAALDKLELKLGFVDYKMKVLSVKQRVVFAVIVIIIVILSLVGNIATLIVAVKSRKIRLFFRTCLASLALSDLSSTIFSGLFYLAQYFSEYVGVWLLGDFLCSFLAFITTVATLVNSMTLVGIALDRYLAVFRIAKGAWEPGGIFCIGFVIVIWGLSAGIASPMVRAYENYPIHILQTDPRNSSIITGLKSYYMCAANKKTNAHYSLTLFTLLYIPMVIAFIWLNSVIACEILNRRKTLDNILGCQLNSPFSTDECNATTSETISSKEMQSPNFSKAKGYKNKTKRDERQLRMFWIIFLLMLMYLVCRLPSSVYLILIYYNLQSAEINWTLKYSFAILSLFNCVMNPLLYAFLTQTIKYARIIFKRVISCCGLRRLLDCSAKTTNSVVTNDSNNAKIFIVSNDKE